MRVLVAAASAVTRAGLKALVEDSTGAVAAGTCGTDDIVGCAHELNPDAILWQVSPDEDAASTLRALADFNPVLICADPTLDLIKGGAHGVLPLNASADQIAASLEAAATGLAVFPLDYLVPAPDTKTPSILTARETEVLRMIAEGLANKEIAWRLGISDHTVKFHVSALLGKLGVSGRAEAISAGIRQGLIML
jgi:DNA-binding NarL/FixJ family response regulator